MSLVYVTANENLEVYDCVADCTLPTTIDSYSAYKEQALTESPVTLVSVPRSEEFTFKTTNTMLNYIYILDALVISFVFHRKEDVLCAVCIRQHGIF